MNKDTRNALRSVVGQSRRLLEKAVTDALQGQYGIHPTGEVEDASKLKHLAGDEQEYRSDLVAHLQHIQALGYTSKDAHEQLVREIAFTHLNRLCAYKMMEVREVWVGGQRFRESVSRGVKSQGFQFYLARHEEDKHHFDAGRQEIAYRHFLGWLGGTLSEEIGVLFSPNDPANRLFPPQRVIDDVLDLLNGSDLADIWGEDEAIGWVYQYFTPKEQRDQARKKSTAPRNSYELAFRNQFFTPRYVVEFLTDNTLGRIWYEMRQGHTKLKDQCRYMVRRPTEVFLAEGQSPPADAKEGGEGLSQDALLKLPVYVPFRAKKDPRDLRVLDPACGSGHFLLYCFDLLLAIYEEAYADPDLGPTLKAEYPTLDALRRDVPRLILAYNLHGIDIDLRATQIAALALWLRCQRAYKEMGVKGDRPKTSRTNIVCAEPMPGEKNLLSEFVTHEIGKQPEGKLLGQLVEDVFDKMKLAGEVGSLLKIDEDVREAVHEARRQFQRGGLSAQPSIPGFGADDDPRAVRRYAVKKLPDEQFFEQAEVKVVEALRAYAEKAHTKDRMQRRLFADDAVSGFAFIEVCHRRFDVVLMNPPFGASVKAAKAVIERRYPRTKNDLYAAFVERGLGLLHRGGLLGAITSRTGFFTAYFRKWREDILLEEARPTVLADLGQGVLDTAMVETAAYCVSTIPSAGAVPFVRLLDVSDRQDRLAQTLEAMRSGRHLTGLFLADPAAFRQVPGSPFTYWVGDSVRQLFQRLPPVEGDERFARVGLQTSDDFRFLRCWWEVGSDRILDARNGPEWSTRLADFQTWCKEQTFRGKKWVTFAKGGDYSPYYADPHLVVNWGNDAEDMKAFAQQLKTRQSSPPGNGPLRDFPHYFRAGLTWSRRSQLGFSVRCVPAAAIFADKGPMVFAPPDELLPCLGVMNSSAFKSLLTLQMAFGSYEVGVIQRTPAPPITDKRLTSIPDRIVGLKRTSQFGDETNRLFQLPGAATNHYTGNLTGKIRLLQEESEDRLRRISDMQQQLDELSFRIYRIPDPDRLALEQTSVVALDGEPDESEDSLESVSDETEAGDTDHVHDLISFAVGCVLGRWDIRHVTDATPFTEVPDPFSPLPACPPGMLVGKNGLPVVVAPPNYPIQIDDDGIVPDDPDHAEDIVRRVRGVLELIFTTRAGTVEQEVCDSLGVGDLRDYFRKPGRNGFWENHLARYSKSRRKAPIYWLLQSSDQNYGLWVYYHRLNKDTLFKALQPGGPVQTKINLEESRLEQLRSQKVTLGDGGKGVKKLDKDIEKKELLVAELQDFEEKLRRAANLAFGKGLDSGVVYDPDLNDGVVLNIAPLWELVPWKDAKSYWDDLTAGEYEWSSMGKLLRKKKLVK